MLPTFLLPSGKEEATFAAKQRWPGVAGTGLLVAGGMLPRKPLQPCLSPGGGTNAPPLVCSADQRKWQGAVGAAGGMGTRRKLAVATGGLGSVQGAGGD